MSHLPAASGPALPPHRSSCPSPAAERFGSLMPRRVCSRCLSFNRGLHCPLCRAQLSEVDRRFDELAEKGIDVVSVSGENEQRASLMREEWKIDKVPLAYGLSEAQMREWGLFVSRGINADEAAVFNEPALFLISPDGSVYYESILSMPVGRPRLDDLLGGIGYWTANDYPPRGGA